MDEEWINYGYTSCKAAKEQMSKMHHLSTEQDTYNNLCSILIFLYDEHRSEVPEIEGQGINPPSRVIH